MKKLILIPTLLVAAPTPLINLASCAIKYKVTLEEMLNAIAFKGIDYLQFESSSVTEADGEVKNRKKQKCEMSPTVYHSILEEEYGWGEEYVEKFVIKNGDNYSEFFRDDPNGPWEYTEVAFFGDFRSVMDVGADMIELYEIVLVTGKPWTFDNAKKCYWSELLNEDRNQAVGFYFENKKLIKNELLNDSSVSNSHATYTFTYNKLTPTPPIKPGI